MMVQLRPRPAGLVFPRAYAGRPRYLAGMGLTPGYTPAQQAMADAYAAQFNPAPAGGAVYVAPPVSGPPACSSSPFANISDSPECIAALLASQQADMAAHTAANYNVDLQNCLNTFPQPPDCYERTFGLTLPNSTGGTNILTPNAGVLLGPDVAAAAAAKAAMDAAAAVAAKPAATTSPTSTPAPGAQTPQTTTQTSGGSGAPGGSTSGASVPSDKTIYWILGGGTLAVILFFMVTR